MARTNAYRTIALTVALGLSLAAARAETPEQIQALDREWAQACVHADIAKLEQILSDDLTYTHSSGQIQTKAEFIATVREGKTRYRSIEFQQSNVRIYANSAVSNSEVRVNLTVDGKDVSVHPRFLHVWVKQDGHWQLAAHQGTKID
jgi:ketosteroid isomerase-like protein